MTTQSAPDWAIFDGTDTGRIEEGLNIERLARLPDPPPWRCFETLDQERAQTFLPDRADIERVNAALYLRRPLLITGKPGTGKTTLVYAVARELGLGPVLRWSITSRSTLQDGLYQYDAVARLQDTHLEAQAPPQASTKGSGANGSEDTQPNSTKMQTGRPASDREAELQPERHDIGRYLTLGQLGTAFFANGPVDCNGSQRYFPRVLLVDEIDKSDIDLPNDLLHVFEEGRFEIPELVRLKNRQPKVEVRAWGKDAGTLTVRNGEVPCLEFPLVVMTSNGEREFPPAFLRRCLQLQIEPPDRPKLERIVRAHLFPLRRGTDAKTPRDIEDRYARHAAAIDALITEFLRRRDTERQELATDQLLNAISLTMNGADLTALIGTEDDGLLSTVLAPLSGG